MENLKKAIENINELALKKFNEQKESLIIKNGAVSIPMKIGDRYISVSLYESGNLIFCTNLPDGSKLYKELHNTRGILEEEREKLYARIKALDVQLAKMQ